MRASPPKFSVAPMMDWTDRHCRYFHRLISARALLFTEMVVAQACLKGDRDYLLGYDASEHPIALQLGGNDPGLLREAAAIGSEYGYDEINLNVGCPSDRVQSGCFGLQLFSDPKKVALCVEAMQAGVGQTGASVSVKTRLGVDHLDHYQDLYRFVENIAAVGCSRVYIHARKGWLKGLSPKENRTIPPLDYERVYRLKQDFPALHIGINGGIESLDQCELHLKYLDSVMMGREAYHNPYILSQVDARLYGSLEGIKTREAVIQAYMLYMKDQLNQGVPLTVLIKPLFGLFHKTPGAQRFRRYLSEHAHRVGNSVSLGLEVILHAVEHMKAGLPKGPVDKLPGRSV